jgi:hypothetical protein
VEADETNYFVSYMKKFGNRTKAPGQKHPRHNPWRKKTLTKSPPIMKLNEHNNEQNVEKNIFKVFYFLY